MGNDQIKLAHVACRVASEVPHATMEMICQWIAESSDLDAARRSVGRLPHPHYRALVMEFLANCLAATPTPTPTTASLMLLTATCAEKGHREEQAVELVWTGPDVEAVPFRRTEQAILQVLDSASRSITLVSYAVYRVPNVCQSLVRAARRGVAITVIVETPDRLEGQNEYSTLAALGPEVAACSRVFYWPQVKRPHQGDKPGILHVKCVAADSRWLFLSSANLTEYAFSINMELGVLVRGGPLPRQVEENFNRLIVAGALERV